MRDAETRIEAVTVYTDRALVRRRGRIALPGGSHEVRVAGLPVNLLPETVRASARARGAARLLGTDVSRTFHAEPAEARAAELQAQIEALEDQHRALERQVEALTSRRTFLQTLAGSLGSELARGIAYGRSTFEAGAAASDFLSREFARVDGELQTLEVQRRRLLKELDAARARLQNLGRQKPTETQQITVLLETEAEGDVDFEVSYQVTGASWTPLYDLRIASRNGESRLALAYMAHVVQKTGESWEDVSLSLSTAKPSLSLYVPDLEPWFLSVYTPPLPAPAASPPMRRRRVDRAETADDYEIAAPTATYSLAIEDMAEAVVPPAEVEDSGASVTFNVGGGTGIPNDGSPHKVHLGDWGLPTRFDYVTAPRSIAQTYRRARVTNGGPALLLPGKAQIFDGDEYIGSTRLSTVAPGQEFELFLGVDDRIKVERKLAEGSVDKKFLVDVRRMVYAYEIKVQNLKSTPETVTVWDQQPVSRHEHVKIRRTEIRPAPVEETELGKLRWELQLAPGQEATIRFGFVIEAPRDLELVGLPPLKE